MKFSVGDLVIEKAHIRARTSYNVSKVIAYLDGALLLEHYGHAYDGEIHYEDYDDLNVPGSRTWREGLQRFQEQELFTPEEALKELKRLEEADSKLNQEFNDVKEQIVAKLEEAAKLANEAADMITKVDKTFEDMIYDCVSLYKALDRGGWSQSTMHCKFG